MALLFMDSFDHYATADISAKGWVTNNGSGNNLTIGSATGRRGSNSFRWSNNTFQTQGITALLKTLIPTDPTTCIAGFAVSVPVSLPGTTGMPLASLQDVATTQICLRLNSSMTLSVCRGAQNGTVLGTTATALLSATFAYIEWKVVIHPSAGTVDVRINGVSALSLTGLNTRTTANNSWSTFILGIIDNVANSTAGSNVNVDYDDLYVLDGSGSAPWNAFLGDCRVDARYPTGAGATTGWTPSTGANWAAVDDTAPNGDTDYVGTSTLNATDTYVTQDAPVVGATIYGVQHCLNMKKMDAGTCTVAPVIRHSGVDYPGAAIAPGTSYAYGVQVAQLNPGTSAAWTEAGFNAAEFGFKKTA